MNIEKFENEIEEFYRNMSKKDIIGILEEAGMEVSNGTPGKGNLSFVDSFTYDEEIMKPQKNRSYKFDFNDGQSEWCFGAQSVLEVA